jgi:enoyl-CoA hydratase
VAEEPALQVSDEGPVRVLTLDRPERLNALSPQLVDELHAALAEVRETAGCRVLVLTGAGRGFCAGLDLGGLEGLQESSPQERMRGQQRIAALVTTLRDLPQPVVAAVNGPAAGGGLSLALVSDLRVLADSASLHVAFSGIGLSACDIGVSWLLPRLVGASVAFELLLTGRRVDAQDAYRIGLAGQVVPDAELLPAALTLARQVAAHSPMGLRMTKEVMWAQLEVASLRAGIDLENRTQILTTYTRDHPEAVAALLERRPATFSDS